VGARKGVYYVLRVMSARLGEYQPAPQGLGYVRDIRPISGTPSVVAKPGDAKRFASTGAANRWWVQQHGLHRYAIATDQIEERPSASARKAKGDYRPDYVLDNDPPAVRPGPWGTNAGRSPWQRAADRR
jgi:hypothetical protein